MNQSEDEKVEVNKDDQNDISMEQTDLKSGEKDILNDIKIKDLKMTKDISMQTEAKEDEPAIPPRKQSDAELVDDDLKSLLDISNLHPNISSIIVNFGNFIFFSQKFFCIFFPYTYWLSS